MQALIAFLVLSGCGEPPQRDAAGAGQILSILVSNPGTGWQFEFLRDGRVVAQFGASAGDSASMPPGSVQFEAVVNAVFRLKTDQRSQCDTQVAVVRQGEISATSFFVPDDALFRYLLESFDGKWEPSIPGGRFDDLAKLNPFFPTKYGWDGRTLQWGTMREALTEGKSQGRIALGLLKPGADFVAIGALEGLAGEITVYGGHVWTTKDSELANDSTDGAATLLTAARVYRWDSFHRKDAILEGQLESALLEVARSSGLDVRKPFPFVLEGRMNVNAHVIRGRCPHSGGGDQPGNPSAQIDFTFADEPAILIGFFAEDGAGVLTHHDSRTHVHVLNTAEPFKTGHVDTVLIAAGATIRVPGK